MSDQNSNNKDVEKLDFQRIIFPYLFFWKFFLASIIISISVAMIYLKYSDRVYNSKAKIKLIDKNGNNKIRNSSNNNSN